MCQVQHSLGVANFMREHAQDYKLNPEDMWILGYLYNIKKLYSTNSYSIDDATTLYKLGYRMSNLLSWHDASPIKYCRTLLVDEPPAELILLWKAKYSVNSNGELVGFNECLKELKSELGIMNLHYMIASETVEWIKDYENSKINNK